MKISIIIVTYNSLNLIINCISSIFKYNDVSDNEVEVVVVDNSDMAVGNETSRLIKDEFGDRVKFIKSDKNGGYGNGNNLGIKNSTGDIICIMNPDVLLCEPVFSHARSMFCKNKNLGMLGYKQLGGYSLSFYIKPEYQWLLLSSFFVKIYNKINYFNSKFMYLSGAFFFTDKKKIVEIGCFDENIFMYFEEPDLTNRFGCKNFDIIYNKTKKYIHLVELKKNISFEQFFFWIKSRIYYLDKYKYNKKYDMTMLKIEFFVKMIISSILLNKQKKDMFFKKSKYLARFMDK